MRYLAILLFCTSSYQVMAQPSKAYLMSYLTCSSCGNPVNHSVQLAESNDGVAWTSVPGFVTYSGSVPDVITRNSKLYIYTPGNVRRYDRSTNTWDATVTSVSVKDSSGAIVSYVDPSLIVDSTGKLVMFFLESTGIVGDPATCSSYPCTKLFKSATEVTGSDGTQFVTNSGTRISITLTTSGSSASDPDIFFNGSQYVCYVSKGNSIQVFTASTLHGTYNQVTTLSNGILTNDGGIPSGYYDSASANYWTYIHTSIGEIKLKTHPNFNSSITGFATVVTGTTAGLTGSQAQSPGFCKNTLSVSAPCSPAATATVTAGSATTICAGASVALNANTGTGLTYQWQKDGTNISGATSASYSATAGGSYTVVVTNSSTCTATSSAITVVANSLPTVTITAGSATTFCSGNSVLLTSSSATGNQWYKDGAIITGAINTTYTANASGVYRDTVINGNGCKGASSGITVLVNAVPTKPTITKDTSANLVSNYTTGNQWYKDGVVLADTSQKFKPTASGSYTLKVTQNGCSSVLSDAFAYVVTAIINYTNGQYIKLFPNPIHEELRIEFKMTGQYQLNLSLYDLSGKRVFTKEKLNSGTPVNVHGILAGTYLLRLYDKEGKLVFADKIIKQ